MKENSLLNLTHTAGDSVQKVEALGLQHLSFLNPIEVNKTSPSMTLAVASTLTTLPPCIYPA